MKFSKSKLVLLRGVSKLDSKSQLVTELMIILDSYITLRERFTDVSEIINSLIKLTVELAIMIYLDMNINQSFRTCFDTRTIIKDIVFNC